MMDLGNATFNNWGNGQQVVAENYYASGKRQEMPESAWPQELKTATAMVYWQRLQEAGFVNEDFSRASMSRIQAMYIAKKFAYAIDLPYTWKPFETGWGISHLAQEQRQKKDECKNIPRREEIDRIFAP